MTKFKKRLIFILSAVIIGLFGGLIYMNTREKEVLSERDKAISDKKTYIAKKNECSGRISTTSSVVNNSNLTDCGAQMAIDSLSFRSLYDIYHNNCNSGFGVAVYGCAYPSIKKVYVCTPGTTLYDRRNTYVSWYYIYYQYISYSCSYSNAQNTIRHELLHLVYADLSYADQQRVSAKLSNYETMYANQLAGYSAAQRDDELFVRVGADGRHVDDIELIDLYSKVSAAYTAQKQSYYGELASMADKYIDKYNNLSGQYTVWCIIFVVLIVINIIFLIYVAYTAKKNKGDKKKAKKSANDVISLYRQNHQKTRPKSVLDRDFSQEDVDLEYLQKQIDDMGKPTKAKPKAKKKTVDELAEEFEYFKKKYGIIDVEDDEK